MKRLSAQRRWWIARQAYVSLRRRLRRRGLGRAYGSVVQVQHVNIPLEKRVPFQTPEYALRVAGSLQMLSDPDGTLAAIDQLAEFAQRHPRRFRMYVDVSNVTSFDPPGLLYLASRIDLVSRFRSVTSIRGNFPLALEARKAMADADFARFILGAPSPDEGAGKLRLLAGRTSKDKKGGASDAARKIQDFLLTTVPTLAPEEGHLVYAAAYECLENVTVHAYGEEQEGLRKPRHGNWYVLGIHDEAKGRVAVAILDLGVGIIPTASVQLSRWNRFWESILQTPQDILEDVSQGIRTETGERKRGKGFSFLQAFARKSPDRAFHVLSSGGMITWTGQSSCQKRGIPGFTGTVVSLTMSGARKLQ